MRVEIIIFFIQMATIMSCSNGEKQNSTKITQSNYVQETPSNRNIWKQYKRVSGLDVKDTLPYSNCYIIIDGSKLIYQKEGKEIYTDSIYLDTAYKAKTYRFKTHTSDVLIVTGNNDKELLLKRDAFEGEYEYFRRD